MAAQIRYKFSQREGIVWAALASATAIILALHLPYFIHKHMQPAQPVMFALMGLALVMAAEQIWRKAASLQIVMSIFAAASAIAYIGAVWEFEVTLKPLIYAAGMAVCAGLYNVRDIYALRWLAPAFAALAGCTALYMMNNSFVGKPIIFNELWAYWALPGAAAALAAYTIGAKKADIWSEGLKGIALVMGVLFAVYQVHHFMNGGNVAASRYSLEEMALHVLVGLSASLGGSLLGAKHLSKASPRHAWLLPSVAIAASVLTLGLFVFGVLLTKNPLFNAAIAVKGANVFNTLLLAYALPAAALAAIAYMSRNTRPAVYVRVVAGLSLVSVMVYVTAMVRLILSKGSVSIFDNAPQDFEMYAISAAWLLLGVALLAIGIKAKRKDVRIASALVLVLTVLKTFLLDMASLEGVLRAVSFIALGVVLIVIGRVYQRLLFKPPH